MPVRWRSVDLIPALTLWGARVAWLVVAVLGGRAIGAAAADRSGAVQVVSTVGAWVGWAVGALALAVPSVVTLTVVRAVVPGALAVTVVTLLFGADAGDALAIGLPALVATVLVAAGDTGRIYVQASAYGDERRFGLRPPIGYLTACVVTWAVWVVSVIAAPLAWAAGSWIVAIVATVVAVAGALVLPLRWHQLSRRWLVLVPAGVVVHDPVVLADTLMLPRRRVVDVGLRTDRAGLLDLTGPTPGVGVAIALDEPTNAVLARRPGETRGRPVSLRAFLVAPTRPGAVLTEAARRGLS